MIDKPISHLVIENVVRDVRPRLSSRAYLSDAGEVTEDKGGGHTAHRIDHDAENVLIETLSASGYDGSLFSEESHLLTFGEGADIIVCDPYCNTTLTFSGVRESASTAYRFDRENLLVDACIGDMQIERELCFDDGGLRLVWADGSDFPVATSEVDTLDEAQGVLSLLKKSRRAYLSLPLAREAGTLMTVDGGIVALRLAVGDIDFFADPRRGQPAYEALAYQLVERAGGTVTDGEGSPVDWRGIVDELRVGEVRRQTVVAAANSGLHSLVMESLKD